VRTANASRHASTMFMSTISPFLLPSCVRAEQPRRQYTLQYKLLSCSSIRNAFSQNIQ
jgi:hypothetical protein